VGDVGEWSGVHEHRRAFHGLHQRGLDGIAHEHGHRASHAQVFGCDRFTTAADADDDTTKAFAHILQAGREG